MEADRIYGAIDNRMDERRRERREKNELKQLEASLIHKPKIQQQFVDLKRDLTNISDDQWLNIPEVSEWQNRAKRNPRYDR